MRSLFRSIAAAVRQLTSFRVVLALVTSSAVTASVAGPLAYQALAARDRIETARIAAERPPDRPAGTGTTTTVPRALTQRVSVSLSPDRSDAKLLDDSRISGLVYVFVDLKNVRKVTWYLDGTPFSVDTAPPLDLISGPNEPAAGASNPALPLDTAKVLGAGSHDLVAVVSLADGTEMVLACNFNVLV